MHITKSQPDSKEVVVTAQVNTMMLPVVGMSGILQLCIGPSHMFRKRHIVRESEVSCHIWHKQYRPSSGGYKIHPNWEGKKYKMINNLL